MFKLTDEQKVFVDRVGECLKCNIKNTLLLNAPAGTGKTTMIKYLCKLYKNKILVCCPTNKACSLLEDDGINCMTIHKFLKAKQDYKSNGNITFILKKPVVSRGISVIIIDECSMIDNEMYDIIKDLKNKYLVIYIGDKMQLPPINTPDDHIDLLTEDKKTAILDDEIEDVTHELNVVAFDDEHKKISKVFTEYDIELFTFTKNLRVENKELEEHINTIRESLKNRVLPTNINTYSIDEIIEYFKNYDSTIILSYSNKSVNEYNSLIRSKLFNKEFDELEKYYENEKLIFSGYRKVNKSDARFINFENIKTTYNSNEIIEISKLQKCTVNLIINDIINSLKFFKITDQHGTIWYKIDEYDKENFKKFNRYKLMYKQKCISTRKKQEWAKYYNFLNIYDADLKYNYAMTIYKAQGSQYNNVFIDKNNILKCTNNDNTLKLNTLYTALSRSKKTVGYIS